MKFETGSEEAQITPIRTITYIVINEKAINMEVKRTMYMYTCGTRLKFSNFTNTNGTNILSMINRKMKAKPSKCRSLAMKRMQLVNTHGKITRSYVPYHETLA